MTDEKEYIPQVAMTFNAHPDDQEVVLGGTLAKWVQAGCRVITVVVTDGSSGSNDATKNGSYKKELIALREKEQLAANAVLGIKEIIFMHYPDGELVPTIEVRKEMTKLIRKYKPDVVITGNPEAWFYGNFYINHPDHRATAQAAVEAVFPSAGSRLMFTDLLDDGLEPHNVKRLYIHGVEKPDTWVDISSTIDLKVKALQQHVSQMKVDEVEKWIRDWGAEDGKEKGMAYAENYKVMALVNEEEKKEE
jgi:LmbE family N-acetylglucosaminyl deacetylase